MQAKHTPGPWAYEQETDNSTDFWVFQSNGPVRVAVECSEADARLIAAAPDLLAALQDARTMVYGMTGDAPASAPWNAMLPRIDAVISRATGKA